MRSFLLAGSLALALAGTGLLAQQSQTPTPSRPQPTFAAGSTAVMVDVVVRDKSGKPITDLRAADFELYEDDVRQEIGDMALVAPPPSTTPGGAIPTAAAGAPNAASKTVATPTFVALVFDRLSPEGRALAYKGAMTYLDTARDNDFAGVFVVSNALQVIQTYTSDRSALKKAIDEAASRATANFSRNADRPFKAFGDTSASTSITAGAEERGPATGSTPTNPGGGVMAMPNPPTQNAPGNAAAGFDAVLARVVNRTEATYEAMMRDEQGFATTNGLMALVDALSLLPGRKTVIFFAEGLAIPPAVQARFDSVVATANRANVSVYSVDAAGLRVHSSQTETAANINAIGNNALDRDPDAPGARPLTESLEFNEDSLRKDPSVSLAMLADRTGGFLINNTNNLVKGFQTIDADRRFHYLLTYSPKNTDFKGEWRRIGVKVPKRDVVVRSRTGYLAVRSPGALPLLAYEAPALAALERSPLPKDLPVRGGAFSFPDAKKPGRLALLVAADASTLQVDTAADTYKTDFTILARIRNAQGEVVRKASQPYKLTGPAAQAGTVKQGDVLFFREPDLPPGQYTLDYVVNDALARKAGTGSVAFVVPDVKPGQLTVSSLIVVRRAEKVAPGDHGDNPLYVGDLLLYPNIGEPLRKSIDKGLSFYISITPAAGQPVPTATLELLSGTQSIGQVPMQLAAPGPDGRIRNSAQLPLANFPPGDYGLRITVTQGSAKEVREARVKITD